MAGTQHIRWLQGMRGAHGQPGDTIYGNHLWKLSMETIYGNYLWKLSMETYGNHFWKPFLETIYGNHLCLTLFDHWKWRWHEVSIWKIVPEKKKKKQRGPIILNYIRNLEDTPHHIIFRWLPKCEPYPPISTSITISFGPMTMNLLQGASQDCFCATISSEYLESIFYLKCFWGPNQNRIIK